MAVHRASTWIALVAIPILSACGEDEPADDGAQGSGASGGAGGSAPAGCAPGEVELPEGGCRPAGVPPDACAAGFEADGSHGCRALLPDAPCTGARIAVPGDTICRDIADCGSATWGNIPREPGTQHVDPSYVGTDSDGSEERPWPTLVDAIYAVERGGMIALAAGTYQGSIGVAGKPMRIWGRCPSLVELVTPDEKIAFAFGHDMHGSELRQVAVTSGGVGIAISGSDDVLLDRIWVHDTGDRGLDIDTLEGATSVALQNSVIEGARSAGVFVAGATLSVESSVVRGPATSARDLAIGLVAAQYAMVPASVTLRSSVIERARDVGIFTTGADIHVEGSVVKDTVPILAAQSGWGLAIQDAQDAPIRSTLTMLASVVENNTQIGVFVGGSEATLEATVVRGTLQLTDDPVARGVGSELDPTTGERSRLTLRSCLLDENAAIGVFLAGSDAVIEATRVRSTLPVSDGTAGVGISAQHYDPSGEPSVLALNRSVVEASHAAGLHVESSTLQMDGTSIIGVQAQIQQQRFGRCVNLQSREGIPTAATASIRGSKLEACHEAGLFLIGSHADVEDTVITAIASTPGVATFGDGIAVVSSSIVGLSSASIHACRIEEVARAAVSSFGASVGIGSSWLGCSEIFLDGEELAGTPFAFHDLGDNQCSCAGKDEPCTVRSAKLAAPAPLDPP